jgi:16S rRNA (guanine(966)-N(2))-methyltransferase RsmD
VRITGGEWRSRRLRGPRRGSRLRPTPDALRERAFAVLADRVRGVRFLDLYAGTGAVAMEALSRGAESAVAVERHRGAAALIERNRSELDVSAERLRLLLRSVARAVSELARRGERFDLAWADPPFQIWLEGLEVLSTAFEEGVLGDAAVAVLECPAKAEVAAALPAGLEIERDLSSGASRAVLIVRADTRPDTD